MLKRPGRGDTEDDLLQAQQEFLASGSKPAVQVIKAGDKRKTIPDTTVKMEGIRLDAAVAGSNQQEHKKDVVTLGGLPQAFSHTSASDPPMKKSKFKQGRAKKVSFTPDSKKDEDDLDPEEMLEKHDSHLAKVLTEIVERDFERMPAYYPPSMAQGGFPHVLHRGNLQQTKTEDGMKKKSLFAQQFAQSSVKDFGITMRPKTNFVQKAPLPNKDTSRPIADVVMERDVSSADRAIIKDAGLDASSPQEARAIHEENVSKIAGMSQADILEEQAKLMDMLGPNLVNFFRKRSQAKEQAATDVKAEKMDVDEPKVAEERREKTTIEEQAPMSKKTLKSETADPEKVDLTTEADLPVKPSKEWVHMDKVEWDKLGWTKDAPTPTAQHNQTGLPARFDLGGNLVTGDADIPTHMGLHHHGDEPERAGYTLGELFQLARSANMQQRVLAITTIAEVIRKARLGEFAGHVSAGLTPAMVAGGLLFILRWALDDSTENTLAAAVGGLHAVVVMDREEEAADRVFGWYRGAEIPCQRPTQDEAASPIGGEEEPKEAELPDADLIQRDVVKGLLRMDVVARLRYVLEVWKPAPLVVTQILDILTRLCRHSVQTAYQVTQCPRLIATVVKDFLPDTWQPVDVTKVLPTAYGYPAPQALRLVRAICTAGRNMAAIMLSTHKIMHKIVRYLSQDPEDLQLHLEAATAVTMESWRTWRVLLKYGLGTQEFSEYYALWVSKLTSASGVRMTSPMTSQRSASALLGVLEELVHVTADVTSQRQMTRDRGDSVESREEPALPLINVGHVSGLRQPMESCLQRVLKEFTAEYFQERYDLTFTAACVNFAATWLSHETNQPGYSPVQSLQRAEDFAMNVLEPCIKSPAFKVTLRLVRETSVLLFQESPTRSEALANLPELGALIDEAGATCPALLKHSTVHFVLAVCRLLLTLGKMHKGLVDKLYGHVLDNEEVTLYLRKVCQAKGSPLATNHFTHFENGLQHMLITMARHKGSVADSKLYHQVALCLMTHVHMGSVHTAHDLLSTTIFGAHFLSDLTEESAQPELVHGAGSLQLEDKACLTSATGRTAAVTSAALVKDACTHLPSIRATYLTAWSGLQSRLTNSRSLATHTPLSTESLMTGDVGQLLVPVDWPFMPLVELYNKTTSVKPSSGGEESVPPALVAMVTNALRWVFLIEHGRPTTLDAMSLTLKLSRLMCAFLSGSDLFLDSGVHNYLASLLQLYCQPTKLDRLDFDQPIPGLASFYDLYNMLLDQFEAVSYGDSLFGCYVLLPLQQKHSILLRKAFWIEHPNLLQSLIMPLKQLVIPIVRFLDPEETDLDLIRIYLQNLLSGRLVPQRCPVLYPVAVHHVNRYMYDQGGAGGAGLQLRAAMLAQVRASKRQMLRKHLLHYKRVNLEAEFGLELYEQLPNIRQSLLDSIAQPTGLS